jgi:hemerythrin superfamily protein
MDAVEYLRCQHRTLENDLERVYDEKDLSGTRTRFMQVADDLTMHITSEEEVFYPAVKAKRTEDILLESLEEHLSLKRLLADLLELDVQAQTFEPKFKVLKEQAEHHHKEEEEHLFPQVLKLLDAAERSALGRQMEDLQRTLGRSGEPSAAVADQTQAAAPLV